MKPFVLGILLLITVDSYSQVDFGIDIPLYLTNSIVSIPGALESVSGTGGTSQDLGVGLYINLTENFTLRGGAHFWNKIFNTSYTGNINADGRNIDGTIKEKGILSYSGAYILGTLEQKAFFFGGGIDLAFTNSYSADVMLYNEKNTLIASSKSNSSSYLTKSFNAQMDILFNAGFKIEITDGIIIRPSALFTIPVISLFNSDIMVYDPISESSSSARFNVFLFKYGISTQIKL